MISLKKISGFDRFDEHAFEVAKGAATAFLFKSLGAALAFTFNIVLARELGAEGAGVYYIALTVASVGAVFGSMGLGNSLMRFTASRAASGDWSGLKGVYRNGLYAVLAVSTVITLIVFLLAPFIADAVFSKQELAAPIRLVSLGILPFALLSIITQMLVGLKRIRDSQLVSGVIYWGCQMTGLFVLARLWGVYGAVASFVLGSAAAAAAGFFLWRSAAPQIRGVQGKFSTRELFDSSMPLLLSEVMILVVNWSAIFFLGIWGTKAELGIFGVASKAAATVSFILISVNTIAAPKFAALYSKGEIGALGSTARVSAFFSTLLSIPALFFFIASPSWVMSLFGPSFVEGAAALAILASGQFINVITGPVGFLLIMSGNERLYRSTHVAAAAVNIALNIALIPGMGMTGAAIATSASIVLQNLLASYFVYGSMNIKVLPWPRLRN